MTERESNRPESIELRGGYNVMTKAFRGREDAEWPGVGKIIDKNRTEQIGR